MSGANEGETLVCVACGGTGGGAMLSIGVAAYEHVRKSDCAYHLQNENVALRTALAAETARLNYVIAREYENGTTICGVDVVELVCNENPDYISDEKWTADVRAVARREIDGALAMEAERNTKVQL